VLMGKCLLSATHPAVQHLLPWDGSTHSMTDIDQRQPTQHDSCAHLARPMVGHLTPSLCAVQRVGRLLQVKLYVLLAAARA
jgi:hypothetical protein